MKNKTAIKVLGTALGFIIPLASIIVLSLIGGAAVFGQRIPIFAFIPWVAIVFLFFFGGRVHDELRRESGWLIYPPSTAKLSSQIRRDRDRFAAALADIAKISSTAHSNANVMASALSKIDAVVSAAQIQTEFQSEK